jgi:hypothetical protein
MRLVSEVDSAFLTLPPQVSPSKRCPLRIDIYDEGAARGKMHPRRKIYGSSSDGFTPRAVASLAIVSSWAFALPFSSLEMVVEGIPDFAAKPDWLMPLRSRK